MNNRIKRKREYKHPTYREKKILEKLIEITKNYYLLFGYLVALLVAGLVASIRIYDFFEQKWLSASIIGAIWGLLITEIPRGFADFYESLGFGKKLKELSPSERLFVRFIITFVILIIIVSI